MTILVEGVPDDGTERGPHLSRALCADHPHHPMPFGGFDGVLPYAICTECSGRVYLCGDRFGQRICCLPANHFPDVGSHMSSDGTSWRYARGERYSLDVGGLAEVLGEQVRLSRRVQELLNSTSCYRDRAQLAEAENRKLRAALGFYAADNAGYMGDRGRIARKALGKQRCVVRCSCSKCGKTLSPNVEVTEDMAARVGAEGVHLMITHIALEHPDIEPSSLAVAGLLRITCVREKTLSGEEVQIPVLEEPPATEEGGGGGQHGDGWTRDQGGG